jgi:hypothetical protein
MNIHVLLFVCVFTFFLLWDWGLIQCLMLEKQVLYHLRDTPVHFALLILEMGSHELFVLAGLEPLFSQSQLSK